MVWVLNLLPFLNLGVLYAGGSRVTPLVVSVGVIEFLICMAAGADAFNTLKMFYFWMSVIGTVLAVARNAEYKQRLMDGKAGGKSELSASSPESDSVTSIEAKDVGDLALETFSRKVREAERRLKATGEHNLMIEERNSVKLPEERKSVSVPQHRPDQYLTTALAKQNAVPEENPPVGFQPPKEEPLTVESQPVAAEILNQELFSAKVLNEQAFAKEVLESPSIAKNLFEENPQPSPAPQTVQSSPASDWKTFTPTAPAQPAAEPAVEVACSGGQVQSFIGKLGETVGTTYQQEPLSAPSFELSYPKYDPQNFSFDFQSTFSLDPNATLFASSESKPAAAPGVDCCKRCNAPKNSDFSFCLSCGISF